MLLQILSGLLSQWRAFLVTSFERLFLPLNVHGVGTSPGDPAGHVWSQSLCTGCTEQNSLLSEHCLAQKGLSVSTN